MALVKRFERTDRDRYAIHEEIDAKYMIFERDGRKVVQIDTFGRDDRANPGKQSQTIQLDQDSASALFAILKREFGFS
jgi:hypothetical protein